jgi:hypothetical protein
MATTATDIPNSTSGKPPLPRRWIPVSLRLFLATLAVLGVVGGTIGIRRYRQLEAIREIERLNGRVYLHDSSRNLAGKLAGGRWKLAFVNVEVIALGHTQFSDNEVHHLDTLPNVSVLSLCYTRISGSAVAHLAKMPNLSNLDLSGTPITDADLVHLSRIKKLKILRLTRTKVTNAGIVGFRRDRTDVQVLPAWKSDLR